VPIEQLAQEMLQRELAREERNMDFDRPVYALPEAPRSTAVDPELAATMGVLADAASTYSFLKRRTGEESNPMFQGMSPAGTAASVVGAGAGFRALRALMRRKGFEGLADVLAGNQGGYQGLIAAHNLHYSKDRKSRGKSHLSSSERSTVDLHNAIGKP
jgi:hypothetical protein